MPTLSLCMIVKNEQEVLARCLESVKDIVDEMIIVDTGSEDSTVEIASCYHAKVYHLTWNNHFADARNFSFSKAKSEYILWLDADDIILTEARIELLQLKDRLNKDVYYLIYDYAQDDSGTCICRLYRERIVRNCSSIRWCYPVHECLLISKEMSSEQVEIVITHCRTPAGYKIDQNRNLAILQHAVVQEEYKHIPRIHYYLAREYQSTGKEIQALEHYEYFLQMEGGWIEDRIVAQQRVAQCYYALSCQHPHLKQAYLDKARAAAKQARRVDPRWAEPYFFLGQVAFDERDYEEAIFWYTKCFIPYPPVLSPVETYCYALGPALQLCFCYDKLGNYAQAYTYNERALECRPGDAGLLYNRHYLREQFRRKRAALGPLKLHMGGRRRYGSDYLICDSVAGDDIDEVFPPNHIPLADDTVEAICAEQTPRYLLETLQEWFRVLRAGGVLFLFLQDGGWETQMPGASWSRQALADALSAVGFVTDYHYHTGRSTVEVRAVKPVHRKTIGWVGADQDLRNPQYRLRIYHIDRWLRSRGYRSRIIDIDAADAYDVLIFFRRYTQHEFEALRRARMRGQQVLLDVCEDLFDLPFEWYRPMLALAERVICCSHALAQKIRPLNPRIDVIEEAAEVDFTLNCTYEARVPLTVGWVGMGGNSGHAEALRPIVEELGYRLITIHEHDHADVRWELHSWQQVLAGCDIAIAPADYRQQPAKSNNKVITCMALGLPTIASPLDAYLRIVEHDHNGLIARSAADWKACLERLADPAIRQRIGVAGKATALRYHLDRISQRWLEVVLGPQQTDQTIDIIIPTRNNISYVRACLQSIVACTDHPFQVIVVSSGDAGGLAEHLQDIPGPITLVHADVPLNFAQALNKGIRHSHSPFLCFMNDDVIVSKGWLKPLVQRIGGPVGFCNPLSNCDRGWLHDYELAIDGLPLLPGQNFLDKGMIGLKGVQVAGITPEQVYDARFEAARVYERDWVAFYCTVVSRRVIDQVGLLDEAFLTGCEDLDYCKRAARMGYTCCVDEQSFVLHFGGVSRAAREQESAAAYEHEDRHNHARIAQKYDRPLLVIHTGLAFEPWTAANIDQGGIGGAETAAACMAAELSALGYRAVVFGRCEGREGVYDGVEYIDSASFERFAAMHYIDIFIASRYLHLFDHALRAARRYLWVHDVRPIGVEEDQPPSPAFDRIDGIFCLSDWQRSYLIERCGFPGEKLILTGNGVRPKRFAREVRRQPNRFIYASSPDRGLDTLSALFPAIRQALPDAELHIYYGFDNWDKAFEHTGGPEQQAWRRRMFAQMQQPGVFYHGRVGQDRLAEAFLASDIWFYPTRFTETYCITALEAQLAGAVCVCSDLGALRTTVGERGILLPGDAYTPEYRQRALQEVIAILQDRERKQTMVAVAREWAAQQTWARRAGEWHALFAPTLSEATPLRDR